MQSLSYLNGPWDELCTFQRRLWTKYPTVDWHEFSTEFILNLLFQFQRWSIGSWKWGVTCYCKKCSPEFWQRDHGMVKEFLHGRSTEDHPIDNKAWRIIQRRVILMIVSLHSGCWLIQHFSVGELPPGILTSWMIRGMILQVVKLSIVHPLKSSEHQPPPGAYENHRTGLAKPRHSLGDYLEDPTDHNIS